MPTRKRLKITLLQVIAVCAYLACLLQWAFVTIIVAVPFAQSGQLQSWGSSDTHPSQSLSIPAGGVPSWVAIVFTVAIAIIVIAVTLISLARLPKAIGVTAQKTTRRAAELVVPAITHKRKISPKKRSLLTARIIFDLKLALLVIPVMVVWFAPIPQAIGSRELILFIVALLAGWALILFCLQVALARAFHIPLKVLW